MCMAAPQLLVTTLSRRVSCGWPELIHRKAVLSPIPVHELSTQHQRPTCSDVVYPQNPQAL
jgi:hypothetical protein